MQAGQELLVPFRVHKGIVRRLSLSPASATLPRGASTTFAATAVDYDGRPVTDRSITWATSDPAIATVDAHGVVTATGVGTAAITAGWRGSPPPPS